MLKNLIPIALLASCALPLSARTFVKAEVNLDDLRTDLAATPQKAQVPARAESVDYNSLEWTELGTANFFDCMFTGKTFNTTVEICTSNTNLLRVPEAWSKAGRGEPQPFIIDISDPRCVIVPKQETGVPIGDYGNATIRSMSDWLISDYGFTVNDFLTTSPYYYFNITLDDGSLNFDDWAVLVAFPGDPDNWGYAGGEGTTELPSELEYYYFEEGSLSYHITSISESCVSLTGGTAGTVLEVPASVVYDGTTYAVAEIGANAFAGNTELTKLVVPACVKKIGSQAFKDCSNLEELVLNGEVEIAPDAFEGCPKLTDTEVDGIVFRALGFTAPYECEVVANWSGDNVVSYTNETVAIPASVTICGKEHEVVGIGAYAFWYAENMRSLTIPEGVRYISYGAFLGAKALEALTIPASVESIDCSAAVFGRNTALKAISVAEGSQNFSSVNGLLCTLDGSELVACPDGYGDENGHVTIPEGIATLGAWSLAYTPSVKSLTIGSGVKAVMPYAFSACGVADLVIPGTVATIADYAISGNSFVKTLTFEEGVTAVGARNAYECPYLETVNIPSTLTDWTLNFSGDYRLKRFNVAEGNTAFTDIDGVLFSADRKILIRYPQSYATQYDIPEGTERLFDMSNSILTKVTIPASVNVIYPYCFAYPVRISGNTITQIYMTEINSKITEPLPIEYSVFYTSVSPGYTFKTYQLANLNVPPGSLSAYKATANWSSFDKIQEKEELGIAPALTDAALNFRYADGRLYTDGSFVRVFTLNGVEVYAGCEAEIRLPRGQVYIVAAAGSTFKLSAR